jgi:hypothetical protein
MTDWTQYAHYYCLVCRETCINHVEDSCTRERECRECHRIPDLQATPTTAIEDADDPARDAHHPRANEYRVRHRNAVPDGRDDSVEEEPRQSTASEPKGAPARPGAQRSEHPGTERERQSRSAPARLAGSDPSRVDPEGRAHPPNPEGEGGDENCVTRPTDRTAQPR